MSRQPGRKLEHAEQAHLIQWAKLASLRRPELRLLFAVPNGGDRNAAVAAQLKAEGVRPGVPDLWLPVPRGGFHGLVIEMKPPPELAGKRRQPTKEQKEWIAALQGHGYRAVVCWSMKEARGVIERYLDAAPPHAGHPQEGAM